MKKLGDNTSRAPTKKHQDSVNEALFSLHPLGQVWEHNLVKGRADMEEPEVCHANQKVVSYDTCQRKCM